MISNAYEFAADDDIPGVRIAEALAFSFLIGLAAQIHIRLPFTPVPITGQTLAVLGGGAVFGPGYGMLAALFYLLEGSLGLPFFAGGVSGAQYLLGPTAGYLLGFPIAAAVTGSLSARGWDRTPAKAAAAAALGSAVVFSCGVAGLSRFLPASQLLAAGVLPFIAGDLVKIAIAAGVIPVWRRLRDGIDQ
ncbi:MAG: biotin transporter BioY [Elusimicrobia bacterium]|nr:biotin transporter BioY [Elusimicrobiota bacterium]